MENQNEGETVQGIESQGADELIQLDDLTKWSEEETVYIQEPLLLQKSNTDSTITENFGAGFTRSEKNTDIAW